MILAEMRADVRPAIALFDRLQRGVAIQEDGRPGGVGDDYEGVAAHQDDGVADLPRRLTWCR